MIPKKIIRAYEDRNLPPPASPWIRFFAFCADSILLYALIGLEIRFLIPMIHPQEVSRVWPIVEKFFDDYQSIALSGNVAKLNSFCQSSVESFSSNEDLATIASAIATCAFVSALLYFVLMEIFMNGATLGKKIFRICTISRIGGGPPGILQCFSRGVWKACSIAPWGLVLTLIVIINAYVPFFSYRKRAWHDMLARTDVVIVPPPEPPKN